MSHGADDNTAEPDLTPLLDLVLQLLMFFIINVNFVSDQVNPDIKLPRSTSARPSDKPTDGMIILNHKTKTASFLNKLSPADQERLRSADSVIMVASKPNPMSLLETRGWLKDTFQRAEQAAKGGEVKIDIHIRPDADLEVAELMRLMQACKVAGFKNLKIHAVIPSGGA
jgi:biopolymer transport protein ExbD